MSRSIQQVGEVSHTPKLRTIYNRSDPAAANVNADFDSFDDFRKKHRELTIGGIALAVALPSAIGA